MIWYNDPSSPLGEMIASDYWGLYDSTRLLTELS